MAKIYGGKNLEMQERESFMKRFDLALIEAALKRSFAEDDMVKVAVEDKYKRVIFEKIYPIIEGKFTFFLTAEDSKRIPAGFHKWDFSVLLGASISDDGHATYDRLIPAFKSKGVFLVKEVVAK
jgi:hypothetical protein